VVPTLAIADEWQRYGVGGNPRGSHPSIAKSTRLACSRPDR
jgi:hypothetical protein